MGYTVGTRVAWTKTTRQLKEGLKLSNYKRCLNRAFDNLNDGKYTSEKYVTKRTQLLDKFFYKDKFETKSGISTITSRDRFLKNRFIFTLDGVDGVFEVKDLIPVKKNLGFAKLLNDCEKGSSSLTRTGEFYYHNNVLVMEYVTSSKNVWIDDNFAEQIPNDLLDEFKDEVRNFLGEYRVKNVSCLNLTGAIRERDEIINNLLKKYLENIK